MPGADEVVSLLVRRSGLAALVRRAVARSRLSILVYHDPAPEVLDRHLAYLTRRYTIIGLDEAVAALRERRLPPYPLVLTFDDGHRGNARLAEVLRRHGAVGTVYACSAIVATARRFWFLEVDDPERLKPLANRRRLDELERRTGYAPEREHPERQALSAEEMQAMRGPVSFAAHTRFHPVLTTCDDAECEAEIAGSKRELEALLGTPCEHFSYPNGDYGEREIEALRRAGFASGRTMDIGWNGPRTHPYRLRVLGTGDDASIDRLAAHLSGIAGYLARLRAGRLDGRHPQVLSA